MENKFTLDKLREDPDFAALFAKKAVDIRKNKADLLTAAKSYQDKYSDEINEGTINRQLKLKEGRARGLTDDEVFKDALMFMPSRDTPILNYLFFLLRETKFEDVELRVLRNYADADKDIQLLKEEYERKYGAQVHEKSRDEQLPNMVSFIYKNIGDETFATIKKLKTLAMSDNEAEAAVAFRKCKEYCKKYNLEFDKIPTNS